jgi:acetyltransferase-like isoleucine patch superfamily enzyme
MSNAEAKRTPAPSRAEISPLAEVSDWVELGTDVQVSPFALVGHFPSHSRALAHLGPRIERLVIGARTDIGPGAVIFGGAEIGDDCLIGYHTSIREGARIGHRCIIGGHVSIHCDVEIGNDVKIMNNTHITGGTKIGNGCFFGCNVATSNDRRVDMSVYRYHGIEPPIFGERVLVGSGACILAGVTIGDGAIIGAGAVITRNVPAGAIMLGSKAVQRKVPA